MTVKHVDCQALFVTDAAWYETVVLPALLGAARRPYGGAIRRALADAARSLSDGEPVFAQVSPGNVSSLRAFLAADYRPIASEVLFLKPDAQRAAGS